MSFMDRSETTPKYFQIWLTDQESGLEALDFAMSLADIGINIGADHIFIVGSLCRVFMALNVRGRYTDAALIYEDAAEDYCEFEVHETEISKLFLIATAGDAWLNGKHFDRAEKAYIKALNISSRNSVDLSDQQIQKVFQNLLRVYFRWSGAREEISSVNVICATLFAMAGFCLDPILISLLQPAMVQDTFKERKQARLALDRARKCATPQSFRAAILACSGMPTNESAGTPSHNKKESDQRPVTKERYRGNGSLEKEMVAESVKCSNPTCGGTGNDIMQCLCRGAYYCDRRCQKAHWQEHKRTCAYYLGREKSKKWKTAHRA